MSLALLSEFYLVIRDGRWDRDPMGLLSRDASPGLGTGTGTDFFGTLGTGTHFSGTSRDLEFAWDLCPNESQRKLEKRRRSVLPKA